MTSSPWAVLLCKFADDAGEPHPRQHYVDLFTGSGRGTSNMVDHFLDCSHGNVDISGSRVFGWYTLDQTRDDYFAYFKDLQANPGNLNVGREALISWALAKAKAQMDGPEQAAFAGLSPRVMICMNVASDLFGRPGRAVCDTRLDPSLLGQEMGHGYGLQHSLIEGSDVAYMDPWDTMSTAGPYESPHPVWGNIGPGLNAANMYSRGWLLPGRTQEVGEGSATVNLRPLHRRDLPGTLAARVGPYFVEFRTRSGWDAGIPRPTVLVHTLAGDQSVLMLNTGGYPELLEGGKFSRGEAKSVFGGGGIRVEVVHIDPDAETAKVRIVRHVSKEPRIVGPVTMFGGAAAGGSGLIFINGRWTKVPPHSPVHDMLAHLAVVADADDVQIAEVRDVMRRSGYRALAETVSAVVERTEGPKGPLPRLG